MAWFEVETKIKLDNSDVKEMRKRIQSIATFEKKGTKTDNYFAIQKDSLHYPKKSFRIRATKNRFEITFKKWFKKYWTKDVVVKKEFEFTFQKKEEIENLFELLNDLGFTKWIKKIKYNETYKWEEDPKVSIEINKVKSLGYFLELEYLAKPSEIAKARKKLRKVVKKLRIKSKQINNVGYTKMLWEKKFKKN